MFPTEATQKFPSPISCFKGSMNILKEYLMPSRVKVVKKHARTTIHHHCYKIITESQNYEHI